jgi:ribonuclease HI
VGLIVHIDGGSRGNPGPAGAGVVITSEDGTLIHEGAYYLGHQTNNAAEYHALIRALQRVARTGETTVAVCADSELLVRQITGQYRVKNQKLIQLFEQVQLLLLKIPCWNVRHIPRERNRRADELANRAMNTRRDIIVFDVGGDESGLAPAPTPRLSGAEAAPASSAATDTDAAAQADHASAGAPATETTRAVRVSLAQAPRPGGCPAEGCVAEPFTVQSVLPAGLCIHAAHALLPSIIALLNTEPAEFSAVPTMTVRCMHPGCGASFHVSPVQSSNGAGKRENTS